MELCAGGSVVWLGIKGSFSFLYGVRLCGNQFRDADQVVGDEVQQESFPDTSNPAMLSLAHRAMLLAPAKDAFDHFAALLRHAIARVPCRAGIDRSSPPLPDFGRAIVLRHMRRDVDGSRVEEGRGGLGHAATLRFPSPLIKPDMQISRIRLSDWLSRKAHAGALSRH